MSGIISWLPLIVFGVYYLYYQRLNKRAFGPVSLVILAYVVMAFLGGVLELLGITLRSNELELAPIMYFSACLLVSLWGLAGFRDYRLKRIYIEDLKLVKRLEVFLIVFSFLAIAFFLPFAVSALSGDIDLNRQSVVTEEVAIAKWGMINTFFSLIANMFAVNMLLAFFNLNPRIYSGRGSLRRAVLLLMSSTSYIVYVLAYVGRDGFVYWILTFALLYLLLSRFIPTASTHLVKRLAVMAVVAFIAPFSLITYARFSGGDAGVFFSVLQYGGVQLHQFNDHFIAYSQGLGGKMNFPLISAVSGMLGLGGERTFDRFEWYQLYTDEGVMPWTFATFIGSWLFDFGRWITPVLVVILALISRSSLSRLARTQTVSLSQLLVYLLCLQVVFYGVFYFRQASANVYLLVILLLAMGFKLVRNKTRSVCLVKVEGSAEVAT